jgi:hypothetical protein
MAGGFHPFGGWFTGRIFVTEFQTEPRNDDLERALEYMMRFRRERRPSSDARLKYMVGGLMLNLTGPR